MSVFGRYWVPGEAPNLLLLHHVKNVRIAAFSSRESHSGGLGASIDHGGCAPHARDVLAGEIRD